METLSIVYEFIGEYDTKSAVKPVCPLDDFTGDLAETVRGIRSFDDWGPAIYLRWQVHEISLPSWLSFEDWLQDDRAFSRVLYGETEIFVENEPLIRLLVSLDRKRRAAIRQLMTAKLRSAFRKSLRDQVQSWLDHPENRRFDSPLSWRQWEAITRYIR